MAMERYIGPRGDKIGRPEIQGLPVDSSLQNVKVLLARAQEQETQLTDASLLRTLGFSQATAIALGVWMDTHPQSNYANVLGIPQEDIDDHYAIYKGLIDGKNLPRGGSFADTLNFLWQEALQTQLGALTGKGNGSATLYLEGFTSAEEEWHSWSQTNWTVGL